MLEIKYHRKLDASLNMTPMIDIVFQLLIFFLLTTNFITREGIQVRLPQARSTAVQNQEDITVEISKEGDIYIRGERVNEGTLYDRLVHLIGGDLHTLVVIKADREIVLNRAVKVMDIAKSAGAERLCIATEADY